MKYKYTGQEEDRETGLYYYKARYYDAALGRFITPDSMDFKSEPMGMNRYMYVSGNPVRFTDPSGHCAKHYTILGGILTNALIGVAPGHFYTGGGGSCAGNVYPRKAEAYFLLFSGALSQMNPTQSFLTTHFIQEYVELNDRLGKETFIDKAISERKSFLGFLFLAVSNGLLKQEFALLSYMRMTKNGKLKEPINGIDRGSFNHDFSKGSSPVESRSRASNSRWIKNSWSNIRNPYDFMVASTGTILFGLANLFHGVSMVRKNRYKNLNRPSKWRF